MSGGKGDMLTIVGCAYLLPLYTLIQELIKKPLESINDVTLSERENGYSTSCVLILIALMESYGSRLKELQKIEDKKIEMWVLIKKVYSDFPYELELEECYILRDALMHGHAWLVNYQWDSISPEGQSKISLSGAPFLNDKSYGDAKSRKHAGSVTNKLGLNRRPTLINK